MIKNRLNQGSSEQQEAENKVRAELKELAIVANDILLDQRYKRFANLLDEAEKNTIELLFNYKESDPYKYKSKVDEFLIELRVYRNLLRSVADLANPQQFNYPNLVQRFKSQVGEILKKIK